LFAAVMDKSKLPPGPARGKSLMKRGLEHQFHKSKSEGTGPIRGWSCS
jgi:hypothetical protein